MLARSLCRFGLFSPPSGLTSARADRAARLYAEANAPYRSADFLVVRGIAGYGVWWWDSDLVRDLAPNWAYDPERIVPETLLYPSGEGWRILALDDGYEAQYWREFTLVVSVWRRRSFSGDQWSALLASAVAAGDEEQVGLPEPTQVRADLRAFSSLARVRSPPGWKTAERIGWSGAALFGAAACIFMAGAVRHELTARHYQSELQRLTPAVAEDQNYRQDLETLQQLALELQRPNPLLVVTRALRGVQPLGATPQGWTVEDNRFRLETTQDAQAPVERLAAALEAQDWLYNVSAQTDGVTGRTTFNADICGSINRATCLAQAEASAP